MRCELALQTDIKWVRRQQTYAQKRNDFQNELRKFVVTKWELYKKMTYAVRPASQNRRRRRLRWGGEAKNKQNAQTHKQGKKEENRVLDLIAVLGTRWEGRTPPAPASQIARRASAATAPS